MEVIPGRFFAFGGLPCPRRQGRRNAAGDNAENTFVFSMAFSPDPWFTGDVGGGQGFRWAAKSEKLTATLHLGQKSGPFFGGYMIRPPGLCKYRNRSVFRYVARRHRPSCQPFNRTFPQNRTLVPSADGLPPTPGEVAGGEADRRRGRGALQFLFLGGYGASVTPSQLQFVNWGSSPGERAKSARRGRKAGTETVLAKGPLV